VAGGIGEERPSPLIPRPCRVRDRAGEDRLREAIRRYSRTRREKGLTIDQKPGCIYGMLLGDEVKDMQKDLEEIKKTLRGVYVSVFLILVGLVLDMALRRMGVM
jgi:hypothetical protein